MYIFVLFYFIMFFSFNFKFLFNILGVVFFYIYWILKNVVFNYLLENYIKLNVDLFFCFNFMKRVSIYNVYFL